MCTYDSREKTLCHVCVCGAMCLDRSQRVSIEFKSASSIGSCARAYKRYSVFCAQVNACVEGLPITHTHTQEA